MHLYPSIRNAHLTRRLVHALRAVSPFHNAKGTVAPNDEHLDERTRTFRSPRTASSVLLSLLRNDDDFRAIIPRGHHEYVMQFAVCGEEIRVNFYLVEDDNSLARAYDDRWFNNGKFSYLLGYDKTVMLIVRDLPGKYYHPNDVRLSYKRVLTVEELAEVDALRNHFN